VKTSALRKSLVGVGITTVVVVATVAGLRLGSGESDSSEFGAGPSTVGVVGKDVRILAFDSDGVSNATLGSSGDMQLRFYVPDRCLVVDRLGIEGTGRDAEIRAPTSADWFQPIWPAGTTVEKEGNRYGVRVKAGRIPHVKAKPLEETFWQGDRVSAGGSSRGSREAYGMSPACVGAGLHEMDPVFLRLPHEYTPPPEAVCPGRQAVGVLEATSPRHDAAQQSGDHLGIASCTRPNATLTTAPCLSTAHRA
jgi:hypothetical protein